MWSTAIDELRAAGLLEGLSLELVVGAGAYIAGEETAMLESMEGRRAMPRLKPPFPSQVGYLGRPTLVQNVETLAHIPAIVANGGEWWARLGTREAKGTRLWSVTGAVARPGCYEAPNGITTRELVEGHAGGFVGEFLTMLGAFIFNTWIAIFAATGVILSAAYALFLYRRIIFGDLVKPALQTIQDLSMREVAILALLVVITIIMGVYPKPIFDVTSASVANLVQQHRAAIAYDRAPPKVAAVKRGGVR